ncbi:S8 family serine peptidase [Aquabacterium sp.]|uniref:S8 family serine peptidase n=1 Tax=Aquabacterium sp. TaxID=1872578 RepID=UPI0040383BA6
MIRFAVLLARLIFSSVLSMALSAHALESQSPIDRLYGMLLFDRGYAVSINAMLIDAFEYAGGTDESHAQWLGAPSSALGYASQPNTGDVFRIPLEKGDVLAVDVAPVSAGADLDLFAHRVDGRFAGVSFGIGTPECVRVTQKGDYYVRVMAASGAARYWLRKFAAANAPNCENETFKTSSTRNDSVLSGIDVNVLGDASLVSAGAVKLNAAPSQSKRDALAWMGFDGAALLPRDDFGVQARKSPVVAVVDGGFGRLGGNTPNIIFQAFGKAELKVPQAKTPTDASTAGHHGADMINVIQHLISKVPWGAQPTYMALQVYGATGEANMSNLAQAVLFASRLPNRTGKLPSTRADVINISMGASDRCNPDMQEAVELARAQGVLIVAAAGNEADNQSGQVLPLDSPASCHGVISVGSVNSFGLPSRFTHSGPQLSLVAPGGDTSIDAKTARTRCFDPGWLPLELAHMTSEEHCGSSISTAFVSAVMALMKARAPVLSPEDVDQFLRAGRLTNRESRTERDELTGYGVVNVRSALEALRPGGGAVQSPPFAPRGVLLDESRQQGLISVRTQAGDRLFGARMDSPEFSVTCESGDANAEAWLCRVGFNRKGRRNGLYTAYAEINTLNGTHRVPVWAVVRGRQGLPTENFGVAKVWLIDAVTHSVVSRTDVTRGAQGYTWRLSELPPGRFYVVAGVDIDGNGRLCEELEPCGALLAADGSLKELQAAEDGLGPLNIRMQLGGLPGVRAFVGAMHP